MKEKVVLKSTHPELYGDLVIECRVIGNDQIGEYLESIPGERKFIAYKNGEVKARKGKKGEKINTVLKTVVDGKEYIFHEETATVNEREYEINGTKVTEPDIVITNISSTSNEEYVVKYGKFISTYTAGEGSTFVPTYDPRAVAQVSENVIIVTAWGARAICLKGSYIVTYNADENDYNTIESGAFDSTYVKEETNTKKLKRN